MAKKKKKKRSLPGRQTIVLRMPPQDVRQLDVMAASVGMSRNALCVLMLRQFADIQRLASAQPGLFKPMEQLISNAMQEAMVAKK